MEEVRKGRQLTPGSKVNAKKRDAKRTSQDARTIVALGRKPRPC